MKVFILGAGGMLGHKIYLHLKDKFETWAIARAPFSRFEQSGFFSQSHFIGGVNLDDQNALRSLLETHKPDVICNCAGVTTRKIDGGSDTELIRINSLLPHQLLDWATANSARVIHFSTDCVFSGKTGPYTEGSIPDASDLYGRSKFMGELQKSPALTIRSSIIGRELVHNTELVEWLISQRGGSVKGYSEVFYSGVTTNYMAYIVEKILRHPVSLSGLFHLASPRISKFELLKLINESLGLGIHITADNSVKSDKSLVGNRLVKMLESVEKPEWPGMISGLRAENDLYKGWKT